MNLQCFTLSLPKMFTSTRNPKRKCSTATKSHIQPLYYSHSEQYEKNPFNNELANKKKEPIFESKCNYSSQFINYKKLPSDSVHLSQQGTNTTNEKTTYILQGKCETSSQFLNYKKMPTDGLDINVPTEKPVMSFLNPPVQVRKLSDLKLFNSSSSSYLRDEKEMSLEIKVNIARTEEVASEIKELKTINPITLDEVKLKAIILPPPQYKKTLILDLDETLIWTLPNFVSEPSYKSLPIHSFQYEGEHASRTYQFAKRPYLDFFLHAVASEFELIVSI